MSSNARQNDTRQLDDIAMAIKSLGWIAYGAPVERNASGDSLFMSAAIRVDAVSGRLLRLSGVGLALETLRLEA